MKAQFNPVRMQNKLVMNVKTILLPLFTFAMWITSTILLRAEDDAAVLNLLPRGMDTIDNTDAERYQRLLAMGEKAYPALARELLRTTDATIAGRIISIFSESRGNKKVPRAALRQFIRERISVFGDRARVKMMVANGLGKFGEREDAALLQEMLSDESAPVKIRALRGLSKIGGPDSVKFLKQWKMTRPKNQAAAVEKSVDTEAEKALDAINRRRSGD